MCSWTLQRDGLESEAAIFKTMTIDSVVRSLLNLERFKEACTWGKQALAEWQAHRQQNPQLVDTHIGLLGAKRSLMVAYQHTNEHERAEKLAAEGLLALRSLLDDFAANHLARWEAGDFLCEAGKLRLALGDHAEAYPLLQEAHEHYSVAEDLVGEEDFRELLQLLIQCSQALERPSDVDRWRQRLHDLRDAK